MSDQRGPGCGAWIFAVLCIVFLIALALGAVR